MNLSVLFQKNTVRAGVSFLLFAAILMQVFLPAAKMDRHHPENPLEDSSIREISVLQMGEALSNLSNIVAPNGGAAASKGSGEGNGEQGDAPPEETEPEETLPEEPEEEMSETDGGEDSLEDDGNEDGQNGKEGGDGLEVDLAAVMTWYKYGNEPNNIVCMPSDSAYDKINVAQLVDNQLKYEFQLTGQDARYVEIQSVSLRRGNGMPSPVSEKNSVEVELPNGKDPQDYTFEVKAIFEKKDDNGEKTQQDLTFTFVLHCLHALDLNLRLTWHAANGGVQTVDCIPNQKAPETFTVNNYDLVDGLFTYRFDLLGPLADKAEIIGASYTTTGGQTGTMLVNNGNIVLNTFGADQETYTITVTAKAEGEEICYTYALTYKQNLDVQLLFHWMEGGITERTLEKCQPNEKVTGQIKNNQLSAGAISYRMELTGKDSKGATLDSISFTSQANSGSLGVDGSIEMKMPEGASSNTYVIMAKTMIKGQYVTFQVELEYTSDVSLQMTYYVKENGATVTNQILCDAKGKQVEIFDNQLTNDNQEIDGILHYSMELVGSEAAGITITEVTCYQASTKQTLTLTKDGSVKLLLMNDDTPGDNQFVVKAKGAGDTEYSYEINVRYKHRGENKIKIETNLIDGQTIINDTVTNLNVKAWSEDDAGQMVSFIPANGVNTKLIVQLDGKTLQYVSSSGAASEYHLVPENPVSGDNNTHTLRVYAEDAKGNWGELTLTLNGQRQQKGQEIGKITINVDMTVLGLGVVATIPYTALADEPISYVVKKILGETLEPPFGAADQTLGMRGRYDESPDHFYLEWLNVGIPGIAPPYGMWSAGATEEELQAIYAYFANDPMRAILWRCIARSGLNPGPDGGDGAGEQDYTSGSGWLYSIDGYIPGQGMHAVTLNKENRVLTLHYTLAYGGDMGHAGQNQYDLTGKFCVRAANGRIEFVNGSDHLWEETNGVISCRCCGIVQGCPHESVALVDVGDGTHVKTCSGCDAKLDVPSNHNWEIDAADPTKHTCQCGASGTHEFSPVSDVNIQDPSCVEEGLRLEKCDGCGYETERPIPVIGHDYKWIPAETEHYQHCDQCGNTAEHGAHDFQVSGNMIKCSVCKWDDHALCMGALIVTNACDGRQVCFCEQCGYFRDLGSSGYGDHYFVDGSCYFCGEPAYTGGGNDDDEETGGDDPEIGEPENPGDPDDPGTEEQT